MKFRVWAPNAKQVEVVFANRRHPMNPGDLGCWSASIESAQGGTDYAFSIDGGPARPDPRSPWQPVGVHGLSRLVDHADFTWSDNGFQAKPLAAAIIYEMHVGTFTAEGTFRSAIERLDHLVELGVSHVELMPVADFPGDFGWGYDGVALFAPRQALWRTRRAQAVRQRGALPRSWPSFSTLFTTTSGRRGNYTSQFGPYFSERHQTPWGGALNFDGPMSDHVRRHFCDNAHHVAARLSHGRAAPGCGSCNRRHGGDSIPRAAGNRGRSS